MPSMDALSAWFDIIPVDALIWLAIAIVLLYGARRTVHGALRSIGNTIYHGLRALSHALLKGAHRLRSRNHAIMLQLASRHKQEQIEREFAQIYQTLSRDLAAYSDINRNLSEQLSQREADYQKMSDAPPTPPEWLAAVDAVARVPRNDAAAVASVLHDIEHTLVKHQRETISEYRRAVMGRQRLLRRILPYWRRLSDSMSAVENKVAELTDRLGTLDQQLSQFSALVRQAEGAARSSGISFASQFFISSIILAIAGLGGFVDFQLAATALTSTMHAGSVIGPWQTSSFIAFVLVTLQLGSGIMIVELLGATRMLTSLGNINDRLRRRLLVAMVTILVALAVVGAGLTYVHETLAAQQIALTVAAADTTAAVSYQWIGAIGQALLAFLLPFALVPSAISLERFVFAGRVVLGSALEHGILAGAIALRLLGSATRDLMTLVAHAYDLLIFLPLTVERWIVGDRPIRLAEQKELAASNPFLATRPSASLAKSRIAETVPASASVVPDAKKGEAMHVAAEDDELFKDFAPLSDEVHWHTRSTKPTDETVVERDVKPTSPYSHPPSSPLLQ